MSQGPRQVAHLLRKELHGSIARQDVESMRKALAELYDDETSPLKRDGSVARIQSYAPVVEALILSAIYAPGTSVDREMRLNFQHTHKAFGMSSDDYEVIQSQLAGLRDKTPKEIPWCENTRLHTLVKPFRHESLFDWEIVRTDS